MQCSCGAETIFRAHTVKQLDKALEWYSLVREEDLPITVNRDECTACGRMLMRPYTPSPDNSIEEHREWKKQLSEARSCTAVIAWMSCDKCRTTA